MRAKEWTEGPTKGRHARPVPIGDLGQLVLERRRQVQELHADLLAGVKPIANAFVLSRAPDGSAPCLPDGLSLGFARITKELGLPWHFHDLRHFAATVGIASVAGTSARGPTGRPGGHRTSRPDARRDHTRDIGLKLISGHGAEISQLVLRYPGRGSAFFLPLTEVFGYLATRGDDELCPCYLIPPATLPVPPNLVVA